MDSWRCLIKQRQGMARQLSKLGKHSVRPITSRKSKGERRGLSVLPRGFREPNLCSIRLNETLRYGDVCLWKVESRKKSALRINYASGCRASARIFCSRRLINNLKRMRVVAWNITN